MIYGGFDFLLFNTPMNEEKHYKVQRFLSACVMICNN